MCFLCEPVRNKEEQCFSFLTHKGTSCNQIATQVIPNLDFIFYLAFEGCLYFWALCLEADMQFWKARNTTFKDLRAVLVHLLPLLVVFYNELFIVLTYFGSVVKKHYSQLPRHLTPVVTSAGIHKCQLACAIQLAQFTVYIVVCFKECDRGELLRVANGDHSTVGFTCTKQGILRWAARKRNRICKDRASFTGKQGCPLE